MSLHPKCANPATCAIHGPWENVDATEEERRAKARQSRARLVASVAALMSRMVGMESAIECARAAVGAAIFGVTLETALAAAIHQRRKHPETYGDVWREVSDRAANECVAACAARKEAT